MEAKFKFAIRLMYCTQRNIPCLFGRGGGGGGGGEGGGLAFGLSESSCLEISISIHTSF